jgi:hypothetical protein
MSVNIKKRVAEEALRNAASLADAGKVSKTWESHIRRLSKICETAPKTHIAFIGTVLLAKATDSRVDVFALHVTAGTPGAYSARGLATGVLVPLSHDLKIHLGVTGREPLNNQPYFRPHVVSRDMIVHDSARPALNLVCDLLDELKNVNDQQQLLSALAAFVKVRREYLLAAKPYVAPSDMLEAEEFATQVDVFVRANSEGGKRAQAVAAGLMDVIEDFRCVETGRINDPSRHFPGDVAVISQATKRATRVLEVRDKPVSQSDVRVFVKKAAEAGIARAGVLAVSPAKQTLDLTTAEAEAAAIGVDLEIFFGWKPYIRRILFWLPDGIAEPLKLAHERIYERLVELECSREAQETWMPLG